MLSRDCFWGTAALAAPTPPHAEGPELGSATAGSRLAATTLALEAAELFPPFLAATADEAGWAEGGSTAEDAAAAFTAFMPPSLRVASSD